MAHSKPVLSPVSEQNVKAHMKAWHAVVTTAADHNASHGGRDGVMMGHSHAAEPYTGEQRFVGASA